MYVSRTYYTVLGTYYAFDNNSSYNSQSLQYYLSLPAATFLSESHLRIAGPWQAACLPPKVGPLSEGTAFGEPLQFGVVDC